MARAEWMSASYSDVTKLGDRRILGRNIIILFSFFYDFLLHKNITF